MTKERTLQTAIQFGVPLPETCKKLDWQEKTLFSWYENEDGSYNIALTKTAIECNKKREKDGSLVPTLIPAPQMHEIAPLVPDTLSGGYQNLLSFNCSVERNEDSEELVLMYGVSAINEEDISFLFWDYDYEKFETSVNLNHYAQAYAELYIKLREAGLIK